MDIRKIIKKVIKEEFQTSFGDKGKAKLALIALSNGVIGESQIEELHGDLSGADLSSSGYKTSEGDVTLFFNFEGTTYGSTLEVVGGFYITKGDNGRIGYSIDHSQAPEPDDYSMQEVKLRGDSLTLVDEDSNEYEFSFKELGTNVVEGVEKFLSVRYDPATGKI